MAIQNKNLTLVKYILEKVPINIRQAMCNHNQADEEDFMQDANVELQAFSLICACANKDADMLIYLWQNHAYLWTENHLEPVLRQLIEMKWIEGLKLFLTNPMTHSIIRGLPA